MTPRRTSTIKRRERLSAAIDALAAAVPGGALMAATDPADFLLAVRVRLAEAEERAARAEREITIRSCECGVEEACRLVRERDEARAEAERITAKRRRLAFRARRLLARVRAERDWADAVQRAALESQERLALQVNTARAEAARLRKALAVLVQSWEESPVERFERLADLYRRETGQWAPGKDVPDACNDALPYPERRERWEAWLRAHLERTEIGPARRALAEAATEKETP